MRMLAFTRSTRVFSVSELLTFLASCAKLADFNRLATLPDNSPLLADQIRAAQRRLPDKIRAQQEKEKDEVIGKLKDLGNTLLGALNSRRSLPHLSRVR